MQSVVVQERLIKQIYFPKLVLPVAASASGVVNFAFGLVPLFAMLFLIYPSHASAWLLALPVIAAVQMLFSLGLAIGVSAVNVFYRDINNLSRHLLRFWFFLSPALYGTAQVEKMVGKSPVAAMWFTLNPWTYILESYRNVIYYGTAPDWGGLGIIVVVSVILVGLAILFFKRVEPSFAKVL